MRDVKKTIDTLWPETLRYMASIHPTTVSIIRALGLEYQAAKARRLLNLKAREHDIKLPGSSGYKLHRQFTNEEVFVVNPPVTIQTVIRRYGTLGHNYCMECGIRDRLNGKPLKLVLHFLNGNKKDCRLDNLELLCPNCFSQLPTKKR